MIRRAFIKTAGSMVAGLGLMATGIRCQNSKRHLKEFGIQLYTVRNEMADKPIDTLQALRDMGYNHVESARYHNRIFYGMDARQWRKLLDDTGLKMYSGHIDIGYGQADDSFNMQHNWEQVCEDASIAGQKYIVSGWLPKEVRESTDQYHKLAELFNHCGEIASQFGLQLCHHNHHYEFQPLEGIVPFEILADQTDPQLLKFELDHYWVHYAGFDYKPLLTRYVERFPLFHIKDMGEGIEHPFTEVGTGVINWSEVFSLGLKNGLQYFYVEQDDPNNHPPLESARISINYLKALTF